MQIMLFCFVLRAQSSAVGEYDVNGIINEYTLLSTFSGQ